MNLFGKGLAERDNRVKTSEANAVAVQGENEAKISIANSDAIRREREAEAMRRAIASEKVQQVKALEEAYLDERIRENAKGEADAKGLYEILTKQAKGYEQVVKAAGGYPTKAFQLLLIEKLPELVRTQVEAVKNIKIDKITVWDSGNGNNDNGNSSTANFVSGMMKTVPPLNDVFNMAVLNLPTYLKGADNEAAKDNNSNKPNDDEKA